MPKELKERRQAILKSIHDDAPVQQVAAAR
jgi:hypothetical protein